MSKEIHFLEDGYYVDKLEKDIEKLKEKCNQLQTMIKTYKEVIDEVRKYIEKHHSGNLKITFGEDLLQILDKVGDIDEKS